MRNHSNETDFYTRIRFETDEKELENGLLHGYVGL